MAEYYPLLERAVSGLQDASPEARHAIYDRARNALLGQLRAMDPPIPDEDINRESSALDDAIQRLEARLRAPASPPVAAPPIGPPPAAEPPTRPPADPPAPGPRVPAPPVGGTPAGGTPAMTPAPQRERPVFAPRPKGTEGGGIPIRPAAAVIRPRIGAEPGQSAAAPAAQPRPSPETRPPALKPTGTAPRQGVAPPPPAPNAEGPAATPGSAPGEPWTALPAAPTLALSDKSGSGPAGPQPAVDPDMPRLQRGRPSVMRPAAPAPTIMRKRGAGFYAGLAILVLIAAGIAVAAYRLRDQPQEVTAANGPPVVAAPDNPGKIVGRADAPNTAGQQVSAQPGAAPETAAQAPADQATPSSTSAEPSTPSGSAAPVQPQSPGGSDVVETPVIPVSQRAALLVDAPQDPQKVKTYVGTVVWRTESVSPGQDQPLSTAVRADVDIPDAGLSMSLVLKKNTEPQFPASHTMEFHFTPQAGNTLGPIKQINVPEMRKDDSTPTGDPLVGVPVAITQDYFLVGLSHGAAEPGNLALLEQRNWVDVSLLFTSGKVAKITFEKGSTGQRVIDDAVKSWE